MTPCCTQSAPIPLCSSQPPTTDSDALFSKFHSIVQDKITAASRKLSADLVKGLKELGHRTNQLEQRIDLATTVLGGMKRRLINYTQNLRVCRISWRMRKTEPTGITSASVESLRPPLICREPPLLFFRSLEFDRIHRSPTPKPSEGPPRDVIIKFHYYRKDRLLQATRDCQDLSFKGNTLQLFADLSPVTIAKKINLKPYLQVLQTQGIHYRWGFPSVSSRSLIMAANSMLPPYLTCSSTFRNCSLTLPLSKGDAIYLCSFEIFSATLQAFSDVPTRFSSLSLSPSPTLPGCAQLLTADKVHLGNPRCPRCPLQFKPDTPLSLMTLTINCGP